MQDDLDRLSRMGSADRLQHAFGVVDVDVAHERESEEGNRLLTMDQRDDRRVTARCDQAQHPTPRKREQLFLDEGLQRAEDEEDPDCVPGMDHGLADEDATLVAGKCSLVERVDDWVGEQRSCPFSAPTSRPSASHSIVGATSAGPRTSQVPLAELALFDHARRARNASIGA